MSYQLCNIKLEKSSFAKKVEAQFGKAWNIEQNKLFDLYYSFQACIDKIIIMSPFATVVVKTGFYLQIDDPYIYLEVSSDSNLAHDKGIVVLDSPTSFGHGFRNEIYLMMYNTTGKSQQINPYDRIAMFQSKIVNQTAFEYIQGVEQIDAIKTGKKWIQAEKEKQ